MQTRRLGFVTLYAVLLPLAAFGQSLPVFSKADIEAARRLREHALRGTQAYDIVASLTTEVGPRFAGSAADPVAVAWAVNKLKALKFENVHTQAVSVPHWVRGPIEAAIVTPWPQPLAAIALGGSVGTPEGGIEAEVVQAADIKALQALPRERVEGRIVFVNTRTERTRDGEGYSKAVVTRRRAAGVAAALGAVAVVIRSIATDNNRLAHTGAMVYAPGVPRIAAAAISNPDADLLERQLASGQPVRLRLKLAAQELPRAQSANVIGEIPGSGPMANEIVLLGAHLDSWDPGTGAIDDGAGVAIVMEAARLIRERGFKPGRTLRVVLFANEEFGIDGGGNKVYVDQPASELAQHVVAMEADLGAGPVWRFDTHVAPTALPAVQLIAKVLRPLGIEYGNNATDGGTDVEPLAGRGVPLIDLVHDASQYFDYHHTANDTLDKIDRRALDRTVAAYAVTAYLSSVMNGDFGRLPPPPPDQ